MDQAKTLLKAKGKSFYWAHFFLSPQHAAQAAQLYAICRHVDDLVDEASSADEAQAKLVQFRNETRNGSFFKEAQIDCSAFVELTQGVESDLSEVRIKNDEELIKYCYQVAGTVGIMMCNVLEVSDSRALRHAADLGIAMQLTNICRDVAADALMGRRYLPATLVGQISIKDLVHPPKNKTLIVTSALRVLLHLADEYYVRGNQGLAYLPLRSRFGIYMASRLYRQIGVKLKARQYQYWEGRVSLSAFEKGVCTIQALFLFLTTLDYWKIRSQPQALSAWK